MASIDKEQVSANMPASSCFFQLSLGKKDPSPTITAGWQCLCLRSTSLRDLQKLFSSHSQLPTHYHNCRWRVPEACASPTLPTGHSLMLQDNALSGLLYVTLMQATCTPLGYAGEEKKTLHSLVSITVGTCSETPKMPTQTQATRR